MLWITIRLENYDYVSAGIYPIWMHFYTTIFSQISKQICSSIVKIVVNIENILGPSKLSLHMCNQSEELKTKLDSCIQLAEVDICPFLLIHQPF